MTLLKPELQFMARDRAVVIWMLVVFILSSVAVWTGAVEVRHQHETISKLVKLDTKDRTSEFIKQGDWGSAAYYSFHLTYDSPSDFAFAAQGQRDYAPWKHRIRMLALEGQIYEQDIGNPSLALTARFDFAFLAAFVLPLVIIFLLYDLQAKERVAGRYNLLVATLGQGRLLWWTKAFLRLTAILIAAVVPLLIAGFISGTAISTLVNAVLLLIVYLIFWILVCLWVGSWQRTAPVILTSLIGIWILLGTLIPATGRLLIDSIVLIPSGAEILMTQREAVNDAWDLPKEDTMQPFLARHPEWVNTPKIEGAWDWKWYYAFQQVGDQKAEELSVAYRKGRVERDRLAGLFTFLAPPVLLERSLQSLAETDMSASLAYENEVRTFHTELRSFYYPGLFGNQSFDMSALKRLPNFQE
jgi:ABC-2 type transport system permease protein